VDKLRIGLVGCGFMGRMHASVYDLLEDAELVAVVDKDSSAGAAIADEREITSYLTLDEMLADEQIDVVDVCLPTDLHRDFSVRAAQARKHVFCEKPMALTLADGEAMRDACAEAGVRLMIGHCIRFWPEYAYLKVLIDGGSLGRLTSLSLLRYGAFPSWASDNWMESEARAGGGAFDMHIHDTDFALYAVGKPDRMTSYGTVDHRGVSQVFTTMACGSTTVHLEGGWNLPPKTPFKHAFRAIFERGAAIMDAGPLTIYGADGVATVPEFGKMEAAGGGNISDLGGYYFELKEFVEKVRSGEPFTVSTPESSLASLETVLAEIGQVKG